MADAGLKTLSERLAEWTDSDGAMFALAVVLGIFPDDWKHTTSREGLNAKGVFWSRNLLGDELDDTLQRLVKLGMLLEQEGGLEYKYNPDFNWQNIAECVDIS